MENESVKGRNKMKHPFFCKNGSHLLLSKWIKTLFSFRDLLFPSLVIVIFVAPHSAYAKKSQSYESMASIQIKNIVFSIEKSKKKTFNYSVRISNSTKKIQTIPIPRTLAMDFQSRILGLIWDAQYLSKHPRSANCQIAGELSVALSKDSARICQEDLVIAQKMQRIGIELQSLANNK